MDDARALGKGVSGGVPSPKHDLDVSSSDSHQKSKFYSVFKARAKSEENEGDADEEDDNQQIIFNFTEEMTTKDKKHQSVHSKLIASAKVLAFAEAGDSHEEEAELMEKA